MCRTTMKTLVLGSRLSFPCINANLPERLYDTCHYKENTSTFYLQSPKMNKLNEVLADYGHVAMLDESGKKSYDELTGVKVVYSEEKETFVFYLPGYPSYPLFNHNERKKWIWQNLTRRVGNYKDPPVFEAKFVYQMIEAKRWLENEGYVVGLSRQVEEFLPGHHDRGISFIEKMELDTSLVLKSHQNDAVDFMEKIGYRGLVGDDAGLGKTLVGGKIIWNLFKKGLVKRVLWAVPTSPLAYQIRDEMKGRFGVDTTIVTGESMQPRERLGIDRKHTVDITIYEKHGFIVTSWAMLVKDFTGKTFHEITKHVHFDLIILDEGHRAKYGNKAYDAVMNLSAPCRIILSGTIMPNGDWRELHNMVSAVCPSFVMSMWYFANLEEQKADDYAMMPGIKNPRHEAKKEVTDMVLAMLMKKVTRHVKDDCVEFMPRLAEVSSHVATSKDEEKVIEAMIDMLSDIIQTWQSMSGFRKGDKREKQLYKLVENAKNLAWQDLRRFCSNGAFRLRERMDEILDGVTPVHLWLQENCKPYLVKVKKAFDEGEIRDQPKNPKVLSVLNQAKPERAIVFYNSVKGSIELSKYLKDNGISVRVIVGSDDQFTEEDADELGQSNRVKDEEIDGILGWFWFPWKTLAGLSSVDKDVSVTFVSSKGERKSRVYYVDGYTLGRNFAVELKWNVPISGSSSSRFNAIFSELKSSPSLNVEYDPASLRRSTGTVTVPVAFTREKDKRVLVTTDKLNEGANLQIANVVIFYDAPLSIKQKEQRVARARRMNSVHKVVALVNILEGLDYAIERSLGMKYETAKRLGYPDPNPVSMKEVLDMVKGKNLVPEKKQPEIFDFLEQDGEPEG